MNFVGKSADLDSTIQKHFDEVVKTVRAPKKKDGTSKVSNDNGPKESWSPKFVDHVASHFKPSRFGTSAYCALFPSLINNVPEGDILDFCREYVKIEVLQRKTGAELYWEERRFQVQSKLSPIV